MNNSALPAGRQGYALVMSVLVVSTILLLLAVTAARSLSGTLSSGTEIEQGYRAQMLSEGCMEAALLRLKIDNDYSGNETLTLDAGTCTIRPVSQGATTILETEATLDGHPYRLRVELGDLLSFDVLSWERVSEF